MFARRTHAALDLGADSIKYAVLEPDSGRIKHLWEAPLHPGRNAHSDALEGERLATRLSQLLTVLFRQHPSLPRTVTTAIHGEGTWCRYLELPAMSARELETAVPTIARKELPFPAESASISYVPLPDGVGRRSEKSAVFLVAARKEAVKRVKDLVESCGLEVARLDVTPLALVREFARNHPPGDRFQVLLHVGFRQSQLIVLRGRAPYYVREFSPAGRHFVYGFQMGEQIDWEAALALFRGSDATSRTVSVEPFLQRWIDEVRRTLASFRRQVPGAEVERVHLSGGCAVWRGLDARLAEELACPVTVDGWDRLKCVLPGGDGRCGDLAPSRFKAVVGMALED
jgi:type IV pilus assembly protein PilM